MSLSCRGSSAIPLFLETSTSFPHCLWNRAFLFLSASSAYSVLLIMHFHCSFHDSFTFQNRVKTLLSVFVFLSLKVKERGWADLKTTSAGSGSFVSGYLVWNYSRRTLEEHISAISQSVTRDSNPLCLYMPNSDPSRLFHRCVNSPPPPDVFSLLKKKNVNVIISLTI